MSCKCSEVEYDCALLTEDSLQSVSEIVQKSGILNRLREVGIRIPEDLQYQKNMHCTFRYMGNNDAVRDNQLSNDELHKPGILCVTSIGAYAKDGVLRNLGLRVDDSLSFNSPEFDNVRKDLFTNEISHITVAINQELAEDGRRMAKAVDTQKCFREFDGSTSEASFVINFDEPIALTATAEAMERESRVVDRLEDFPERKVEKELVGAIK